MRISLLGSLFLLASTVSGQINVNTNFNPITPQPIDVRDTLTTLDDTAYVDAGTLFPGLWSYVVSLNQYWYYDGDKWNVFESGGGGVGFVSLGFDSTYTMPVDTLARYDRIVIYSGSISGTSITFPNISGSAYAGKVVEVRYSGSGITVVNAASGIFNYNCSGYGVIEINLLSDTLTAGLWDLVRYTINDSGDFLRHCLPIQGSSGGVSDTTRFLVYAPSHGLTDSIAAYGHVPVKPGYTKANSLSSDSIHFAYAVSAPHVDTLELKLSGPITVTGHGRVVYSLYYLNDDGTESTSPGTVRAPTVYVIDANTLLLTEVGGTESQIIEVYDSIASIYATIHYVDSMRQIVYDSLGIVSIYANMPVSVVIPACEATTSLIISGFIIDPEINVGDDISADLEVADLGVVGKYVQEENGWAYFEVNRFIGDGAYGPTITYKGLEILGTFNVFEQPCYTDTLLNYPDRTELADTSAAIRADLAGGGATSLPADSITVTPTGNLSSANAQEALEELQSDIDGLTGSTVPDGDKGDIDVTSSGTVWTIDTASVGWQKLTQAAQDSILFARQTAFDWYEWGLRRTNNISDSIYYLYKNIDTIQVMYRISDTKAISYTLQTRFQDTIPDGYRKLFEASIVEPEKFINVDSFAGTWGGTTLRSGALGAELFIDFTGTGLILNFFKNDSRGKMRFILQQDGVDIDTVEVDGYNATELSYVKDTLWANLAYGTYSVYGEVITKNPLSSGNNFSVWQYVSGSVVYRDNYTFVVKTFDNPNYKHVIQQLMPEGSNVEYAMTVRPLECSGCASEWIPYHGSSTTQLTGDSIRVFVDGTIATPVTGAVTPFRRAKILRVDQEVLGYHVDSVGVAGRELARIISSHTFRETSVGIDMELEWLRPTIVTGYTWMQTHTPGAYDTLITSQGQRLGMALTDGSQERIIQTWGPVKSLIARSNTDYQYPLISRCNTDFALNLGEENKADPWQYLYHAPTATQKYYTNVYNGDTVQAGEVLKYSLDYLIVNEDTSSYNLPVPAVSSGATGTVESVALSMPTGFSVTGSPVTTTGTLAVSTTLSGPVRGDGSGLTTGNTSLSSEVTGILPIANGGTGLSAIGNDGEVLVVDGSVLAYQAIGGISGLSSGYYPRAASASSLIDGALYRNGAGKVSLGTINYEEAQFTIAGVGGLGLMGTSVNNAQSGMIRFFEASTGVFSGAFIRYDGNANKLHIGIHLAADTLLANDNPVITLPRSNSNVGIGTISPTARLHLPSGTSTAGTASLKIDEGVNTSSPQDGEINHVSDRLNFTTGSTVNVIAHLTDIPDQNATYYEETERQYTLTITGADTIITVDTMSLAIGTDSISMSSGLIENLKSDTVRWQVSYDFFYIGDEDACYALMDLTSDGTEEPAAIPGSAARAEQVSIFGGQMPGRTFHVDVPPGGKIRLCVKGSVGATTSIDISYLTISIQEINR